MTIPLTLIGVGLAYVLVAAAVLRSRLLRGEHGALQVSEVLDREHSVLLLGFFGLVLGPVLAVAGVVWLIAVAVS